MPAPIAFPTGLIMASPMERQIPFFGSFPSFSLLIFLVGILG
jgi:hypothetical protein